MSLTAVLGIVEGFVLGKHGSTVAFKLSLKQHGIMISIPIKTVSPNVSEHWRVKHKRNQLHRCLIKLELSKIKKPTLPCIVVMRRIGAKLLDEEDNLRMALKCPKDVISDWLVPGLAPGRADGDKRITWKYEQEVGRPNSLQLEIYSDEKSSL